MRSSDWSSDVCSSDLTWLLFFVTGLIDTMSSIQHIGVFTSGGDAPGMNACIRAVVRTSIFHKLTVSGIMRGYEGMLNGEIETLGVKDRKSVVDGKSVTVRVDIGGRCLIKTKNK